MREPQRQTLAELLARLEPLRVDKSPFAEKTDGPPRKSLWVRPELVAQIRFTQWTQDGSVRHPSFQGLREGKPAIFCNRDQSGALLLNPGPVHERDVELVGQRLRALLS